MKKNIDKFYQSNIIEINQPIKIIDKPKLYYKSSKN